jgi:PQ loop repeat
MTAGTSRPVTEVPQRSGRALIWTSQALGKDMTASAAAVTEIAGFIGAGLAGAGYVPQISHLIRARCSAGISRLAFEVWLLASVLTTARAIAIHAGVFIMLGGIQILATALIMVCAARYKDTPCPSHLPGEPAVRAATGTGTSKLRLTHLRGRHDCIS